MKEFIFKNLSDAMKKELIKRNAVKTDKLYSKVKNICTTVKKNGINAAIRYAVKYDSFSANSILVSKKEFIEAEKQIPLQLKEAIKSAYKNIYKFHEKQLPHGYGVETTKGVFCEKRFMPIENVGLYIPAGTAPLPSTMLMLGIPAQIAGCKRVVAASPVQNKINSAILYAAKLCGITEFLKIGGAQGIALMAYGCSNFRKVDKIFGPGNQFVTTAKSLISIDPDGCSIDMLAGPSELVIIADDYANPHFVAADLLSQAEHGKDSLVILLTTSKELYKKVVLSIQKQLVVLPRKKIAKAALKNSFCILFSNIDQAIKFSNDFAPEHLIINVKNPRKYKDKIINAGSVFIGQFTPESAGDYASGTNHSLPTYGFARSTGGVSVEMFMKGVTFQSITLMGLKRLSKSIVTLAEAESLNAHAEAVKVRLK
ncbi:MAG: histidinol dehydrogenase [Ignavibacteriaceae bacterium]|nr:histidinol dehydrogenase [Ignavibacteriaceae bacterium]